MIYVSLKYKFIPYSAVKSVEIWRTVNGESIYTLALSLSFLALKGNEEELRLEQHSNYSLWD